MRDNTKKSPIKLNIAEIKFDLGDLFSNEENQHGKNPIG